VSVVSVWQSIGIGHFQLECTWYRIGSEKVVSVHHCSIYCTLSLITYLSLDHALQYEAIKFFHYVIEVN